MPTPNFIKYSTTPDSSGIKVGNYTIGVFSGGTYGPTSTTNYWNGVSPPISGYTIYENKSANGPSIRVASNATVLIDYANRLYSGTGITTEYSALTYLNSLGSVICVNKDYEEIITSGLTVNLDAGFTPSYPKSGTTSYNLSYINQNGTLTNGPTYSSDMGGSWLFDGVNDNLVFSTGFTEVNFTGYSEYTIEVYIKLNQILGGWPRIIDKEASEMGAGRDGYNILSTKVGANSGYTYIACERWASGGNGGSVNFQKNDDTLLNVWNQFVVTFISPLSATTNFKLYNNGGLVATRNNQGGILTNTKRPLYFMGGGGPNSGHGSILRIYNRVLSASEILQNYQSTLPRMIGSNIITNGLTFYVDAGYSGSYPTSGNTWYDISGKVNNGSLVNGPTYSGGSIVFDAVDDYVTFSGATSLTGSSTQDLTMEVFIKFNNLDYVNNTGKLFWIWNYGSPDTLSASTNNGIWFSYDNRNNNSSFTYTCFGNTSGGYSGGVNNFAGGNYNQTFVNGTWNYIAFTIINNVGRLYINGTQKGPDKVFSNLRLSQGATSATMGNVTGGSTSPIPQIAITRQYNRGLTSAEILQNFNVQKSRFGL